MGDVSVQLIGEEAGGKIGDFVARVKPGFAVHHLLGAQFLAQRATAVESRISNATESLRREHRAYVVGSVLTATAFLEAMINELYISAAEGGFYSEFALDSRDAAALAAAWVKAEKERWSILKKYQQALERSGHEMYATTDSPYLDVDHLVVLRNALTHFKSEWDHKLSEHAALESRLAGRFRVSCLAATNQSFFPHLCLGAGCAEWAVEVAITFALDFRHRMALPETLSIDQALVRQADDTAA